jgi:sporulation protein YlmC with PRC-barrel domain
MQTLNLIYVTALIVAPLAAQEEPKRPVHSDQPHESRAIDQVLLSDVLGAKVRLKAKPEDRSEAAAEGKVAKGPNGSVDDLVIDTRNGQASWAVVSVGGLLGIGDKEVAVPASSLLVVRADKPTFELDATEAELKSLPAFDKKSFEKSGLDVAVQNAETSWKKIRPDAHIRTPADATGHRPGDGDGTRHTDVNAPANAPVSSVLASRIKGMNLRGNDGRETKAFGDVDSALVDPNTHTVTYLVVGRGGVLGIGEHTYLVPWAATHVTMIDQKPVLTVQKTTSELEASTRYTKPDKGHLTDENCRAADQYWGVEHGRMRTDKGR